MAVARCALCLLTLTGHEVATAGVLQALELAPGAFTQMRCRCFQPHVVGAYILTGQINPILGQLMALCHANPHAFRDFQRPLSLQARL